MKFNIIDAVGLFITMFLLNTGSLAFILNEKLLACILFGLGLIGCFISTSTDEEVKG